MQRCNCIFKIQPTESMANQIYFPGLSRLNQNTSVGKTEREQQHFIPPGVPTRQRQLTARSGPTTTVQHRTPGSSWWASSSTLHSLLQVCILIWTIPDCSEPVSIFQKRWYWHDRNHIYVIRIYNSENHKDTTHRKQLADKSTIIMCTIMKKNKCNVLPHTWYSDCLCLLGMGPMPWTVNSEIYPLWARSTGNACSAGVNWIFNVLVSLTFLHVAEFLTYYGKIQSGDDGKYIINYLSSSASLKKTPRFTQRKQGQVGNELKLQSAMIINHFTVHKTSSHFHLIRVYIITWHKVKCRSSVCVFIFMHR